MKHAFQQAWKLAPLRAAVAGLLLLTLNRASAQNAQFVSDAAGNLSAQTSETIALPVILGQPQNQIIIPGESASFGVVVADTRGLSYQWYFNSTAISGATADSLLITNVSTNNEGLYSVTVSSASGSVPSGSANLYIDSDGDGLPDSWEIAHFGNLNQTASGDPDGDGVSNLQEYLDGTDPTNAASVLYRITLLNDGGTVTVVPNQAAYTKGQVVTLTAYGNSGAPFHAWTGDVTSRSNSITVAMTTNLNLYAHFLPFTIKWTNNFNGDWNVAANWFPNLAPSTNENVLMPVPVIVTLNTDVNLLNITLGGGGLGPELTGSGHLTISGNGAWLGGTMSGSGATIIAPGATFTMSNNSFYSLSLNGRTLENASTNIWAGGSAMSINGGVITNDAGAVFQVLTPVSFVFGGGAPRFDNVGTFLSPSNGTTTFSGIAFNNYGTVNILGGTLSMAGGGVQAGTVTVPLGTTLNLAGAFTSLGNPSITGAGNFMVSGGTSTLGGTINVTGSNIFNNCSMDLTGNYTCTNNVMAFSGGAAYFDGNGTVAPDILNLNGTLGGAQNVTVTGAMNWTGGTMTGSGQTIIQPSATLSVATFTGYGGVNQATRTLDNRGMVVWGGGNWNMNSSVITNELGASFQIQGPVAFNYGGGSPRFDNAGTFLPAPAGTTSFYGIAFNNYGPINLAGGSFLLLGGGGAQMGTITVPAGATLNYAGGTFTASSPSSITGAGTLLVSGGTANLGGIVNVSGTNSFTGGTANLDGNYTCVGNTLLTFAGGTANFDGSGTIAPNNLNLNGTLGGGNTVTVSSAMNWTGGTMTGSGNTIIQPGAILTVATFTGYGGVNQVTRTLDNRGMVVWGGGNWGLNGGIITNDVGASFQIQGPVAFNYGGGAPRFDNAGTFLPARAGTTAFNGIAFNNYGAINLAGGFLTFNSPYSGNSNSVLNYFINGKLPGTNYGQVQIPGSVVLSGTLAVNVTNHYIPATNDTFTILTAGSRTGAFANFIYPTNAVTMILSNTPTAAIVRVTGVALQRSNLPTAPGIISWWRAENDALDSAGTNNGTLTNGTAFAAGEVGQSFLLDGVADYVVIPDSTSLRPASVTLEAWVKINSTNGIQLIFAKPLGSATLDSYGLAIQNGAPLAAICDNSGFGTFISGSSLTLGQWYHLAFTFDNASQLEVLYVNGVAVATASAGKSMSYDSHPLLLGADIENGAPSYFLNGQIDEASIYDRALGPDEIDSIYNVGSAGKQAVTLAAPVLFMDPISPGLARIYWSTNFSNYHLEYNASLATSNWAASGRTPVLVGSNFVVTNSMSSGQKFYRLSSVPAVFTPPPPALKLQLVPSGMIALSWPLDDDHSFLLQSNTNLVSSNWTVVSPLPSIVGLNNVVTNSISGSQLFYRLSGR